MKKSLFFWFALLLILLVHSCIYSQKQYNAICIKEPHDGDTTSLLIEIGMDVFVRKDFRLLGIDTPEVATKNLLEKEAGKKVQRIFSDFIFMNEFAVYIFEDKTEKFGRPLVEIEIDGICINNFLLDKKLARAYFGEKKTQWSDNDLHAIIKY